MGYDVKDSYRTMAKKRRGETAAPKRQEPAGPESKTTDSISQRYVPPMCSVCGDNTRLKVYAVQHVHEFIVRYCKCPRCRNTKADYEQKTESLPPR